MANSEVIQEFLVSVFYDIDKKTENDFKNSLRGAVLQAELLAKAIEGMAKTVIEGVTRVAKSFDQLYWASERTGTSVQNIRALSFAVSQLGGSYEGARSSLEAFGQHLRTNPGYGSLLRTMGVATEENGKARDQVEILKDLGKVLATKPYSVANQYAGMLGIDEQTMRALMSGDLQKELDRYTEIQKAVGLNSTDAAKASKEFMQSLRELQAVVEAVATKLLTELQPQLSKWMREFSDWVVEHKEDIKQAFLGFASAVRDVVEALKDLAEGLKPVAKWLNETSKSMTGKDGLQGAFELFAVFLATSWLARVLSVFGAAGAGLAAFIALVYFAPKSLEDARANGVAANNWLGSTWLGSKLLAGRNSVRGFFGMSALDAQGNVIPDGSTGGSGPAAKGAKLQNAKDFYDFFSGKGLDPDEVIGVMGNVEQESGFNPAASNNLGGGHGGLVQWSAPRRKQILANTGIDVWDGKTSVRQQAEALWWEMNHGDDGAQKFLQLTKDKNMTVADSARLFNLLVERPGDPSKEIPLRVGHAMKWARDISGGAFANKSGMADPFRYLGGPNAAADRSSNLTQTTHITVIGSSDPSATANAIERKQQAVNNTLLRNTQGSVR